MSMTRCRTPFVRFNKQTATTIASPCGKCLFCVKKRTSQWSLRLMQEDRVSVSAHFITLTYEEDNVHVTNQGFLGLLKSDVQNFIKRLRHRNCSCAAGLVRRKKATLTPQEKAQLRRIKGSQKKPKCICPPIKYYAVGEYGTNTQRPHYHVILFNAKLPAIEEAWGLGSTHSGTVTGSSVGYTLKYISKPGAVPNTVKWPLDDRIPQFAIMSKGLGSAYIGPARSWHHADLLNRAYCPGEDGKRISMPRYYKEKIYSPEERENLADHFQAMNDYLEKDKDHYKEFLQVKSMVDQQEKKADFDKKLTF